MTVGDDVDRLGAERTDKEVDHILVFGTVESAGAVDENAARLQSLPDVGGNFALARGTLLDKGRSPLRHSLVVLAHHAFAGTRRIN